MTQPRRPKLHWTLPPPSFEVCDPKLNEWRVGISDATDSFSTTVWFRCLLRQWEPRDVILAGGRECQSGEGFVCAQRIVKGVPDWHGRYAVKYAWGQWHLRDLGKGRKPSVQPVL